MWAWQHSLYNYVSASWILNHFSRLANYQFPTDIYHRWLKGRNGNYNVYFLDDASSFLTSTSSKTSQLSKKDNKSDNKTKSAHTHTHTQNRAKKAVSELLISIGPTLKEQDTQVWNQRLTACKRPVQAHTRQIPGQRKEVNTVPTHLPTKLFTVGTCWEREIPHKSGTGTLSASMWYIIPSWSPQCLLL